MNEDISPIRAKSKLKKKRNHRQQATTTRESEASSSCSLQNNKVLPINNESTSGNEADVVRYNSLQKENNTDCTTVNKKRSFSSVIGADGSKVGLRQRDPEDQLLLPPRRKKTLVHEGDSTSKLALIDEMDLSQLSAIQKGIISSDLNNIDVKLELERAFTISKDSTVPDNEGNSNNNTDQNTIFYHDFVGRIGPPIHDDRGDQNATKSRCIAFPSSRCNDSTSTSTTNCQQSIISMMNLTRQTCYGISIPLSWCKFPSSQCEQNDTKTKSAPSIDETHLHEAKTTEIPSSSPFLDDAVVEESVTNNDEAITKEASSSSAVQYQGRIRITSVKGATIREVFDIDESDYVIGKLIQGDERYFLEKRLLPAPAPDSSDDDESDEDEDEDCVAVVRYKIVLDAHDCSGCSHEFIERDSASGKMLGWISDRGRLAADPYFILKEM
jgi:hypothetical protein